MLTIRQRGKSRNWYCRGTVTFNGRSVDVAEFNTGTRDKALAEYARGQKEREIIEQLMFGRRAVAAKATIADALAAYLQKPKRPNSSDIIRVGKLNAIIGGLPLNEPTEAWRLFRARYLSGHDPAGQDRYRSVLQAAVNVFNESHGLDPIRLPSIGFNNERIRFLSKDDRDRLIESYAPHVQPIAMMFAFQGPRTQEGLQLKWGVNGLDLDRGTIHFDRTKTGNPRTVALHPRVRAAVVPLWEAQGRPASGHVFLNRHGEPYSDTRDLTIQGGNPLKRAHATACRRAQIVDFTVHDWRHHWASHCVMAGIDMITIMRMGGWKSLRMVQRYAAVDVAHMEAAVNRLT